MEIYLGEVLIKRRITISLIIHQGEMESIQKYYIIHA